MSDVLSDEQRSYSVVPQEAEPSTSLLAQEREARYQQLINALGSICLHNADKELSDGQIVSNWEQFGVVKEAPRFAEQAADQSRQTKFRFAPEAPLGPTSFMGDVTTESEGLQELRGLLTDFVGRKSDQESSAVGRAVDMLHTLTFIGEKEYREATLGIGQAWRSYLDADPQRKLCIITEISRLDRFEGQRKSDEHLKQQILETFSDAELARYSGRIVDQLDDMNVDPDHGKIVMLDDWTISGRQMSDTYKRLVQDDNFQSFAAAGKVEINLIVASADRIQHGLPIRPGDPEAGAIPVRAYYQAHYAHTARDTGFSYISGLHSSVNYGFGFTCGRIVTKSQRLREGLPKLAHIQPSYRDQLSTIAVTPDRLYRLSADEVTMHKATVQAGALAVSHTASGETSWQ